MTITLSASTTQIIVPQQTKTFSALTVTRMVDLPNQKEVKIFLQELSSPITLWSGTTYDAIGQWTNEDVESKLITLFSGSTL